MPRMGAYIRTGAALRIEKEVEAAKSDELFLRHTHICALLGNWQLAMGMESWARTALFHFKTCCRIECCTEAH